MKQLSVLPLIILFLCAPLGVVDATPIFFTDEANFQSAVSSAGLGLTVESFEGLSQWTTMAPFTAGNVTVTEVGGGTVSVADILPTDGSNSLAWDQSGLSPITFTFATPVYAFGIDIIALSVPVVPPSPSTLTLTMDTGSMTLFNNYVATTGNEVLFGGVIDTTPFTTVVFSNSNVSDTVMFDRLQSAPVPEPTTILLLGTGLVGLVGFRKKFKK